MHSTHTNQPWAFLSGDRTSDQHTNSGGDENFFHCLLPFTRVYSRAVNFTAVKQARL
jgi:hypothetical protein